MTCNFLTNIELNQNQIIEQVIEQLNSPPPEPIKGRIYYNTTNDTKYIYDGSDWHIFIHDVSGSDGITSSGGKTPNISITDGGVSTAKIASSAVTTSKIADSAITTDKINDAAVGTSEIADASITGAKIVAKTITQAKIADNTITATQIADNTITSIQIANNAIINALMADNSVGTNEIVDGSVTLTKMADIATNSLIYRKTSGAGVPEVNTLSTLKTDLDLTGTNTGDQNIFSTITVNGQNDIIAGSSSGVLTLIAGDNVTITTNDTNNSVRISSTGSGSSENNFCNLFLLMGG